jgi:hypothetical protein
MEPQNWASKHVVNPAANPLRPEETIPVDTVSFSQFFSANGPVWVAFSGDFSIHFFV